MQITHHLSFKRTVISLLLFGTAFGYLEAAVVSYLREIHQPVIHQFYPGRPPGDPFPLVTLDQLRSAAPGQMQTLAIEIGREAATIVMLGTMALAVSADAGQWAAAFVVAFGVWDITFYIFLKLLLDWPASLSTWDLLFLLPVPWAGPVVAPCIVSAAMIGAGVWHLRRSAVGRPVRLGRYHWSGIVVGAAVIVVSFAMDYRNLMAGRMPHPFNWGLFCLGLTLGTASYAGALVGYNEEQANG